MYNCWRGNVTADPYFNSGNGGPVFGPCSGSTNYYVRADITIPGVGTRASIANASTNSFLPTTIGCSAGGSVAPTSASAASPQATAAAATLLLALAVALALAQEQA